MDGAHHAAALGILYAEDFGAEGQKRRPSKPAAPASPPPPALTQADIDRACIRAVQAAEAAWAASAAERRAEALATVAAGLASVRQEAAQQSEAVADGIARTALSMLGAALPHLCRAHGDTEVRALVARLAPLIAPHLRLVVRVHPGLIDVLADDLVALDDALASAIELRPANLPPGDVRLAWEDGRLARDSDAICAAIQDGLADIGLDVPLGTASTPATGKTDHAE